MLDGARIQRWIKAAVPWWVPRLVLVAAWAGAFVAAAVGDPSSCTAADPGVCGPDVTLAVVIVVLLATPILLWWLPLAGCGAGVLFAVLDLVLDDEPVARVAFGVFGLLCLAVAAWLVVARRRQAAIVAEAAGTVRLDERLREDRPGWGWRTAAAVALSMAGAGGLAWYGHRDAQVAAHEAAAVRTDAVIRSADNASGVVTVGVPEPVRVDVVGSYRAGQVVPVLVDGSWVRLVAEPEDVTVWLSAGLGALALAGILLFREQSRRSARRRLSRGPLAAVEVAADLAVADRAVMFGGRALVPVLPAPFLPPDPSVNDGADSSVNDGADSTANHDEHEYEDGADDEDGDGAWTVEEVEEFGREWRGESPPSRVRGSEPQTVTVAGDLRDGGWVVLITDSAVLLPEAPLRMPMRSPESVPDAPPGVPLPSAGREELTELPVVLRPRPRERVLGALSLLGFAAGPAVVLAGLPEDWWQTLVVLWLGGSLTYGGWRRLTARAELTKGGLVVHGRMRVRHVPWTRLHGVRRDDKGLWIAWEPGDAIHLTGVADRWGGVIMRLRDLSLAAGDPGREVTDRLGSGPAVVFAYVLVAAATLWWTRH
ncbi:hypothetical protein SAMN05421748_11327 [Paractinoplanes atraurantiacus]|uniref:PH domain-containing protein n=1 Tax=Paractinoplanes atraurantiacus TaxID=1036182 RepID=A0A285IX24_9ACTN|nr:hypothetical protein SAMN05421748_11327 [Actinoplanes atraurantiacus]